MLTLKSVGIGVHLAFIFLNLEIPFFQFKK